VRFPGVISTSRGAAAGRRLKAGWGVIAVPIPSRRSPGLTVAFFHAGVL